MPRLSIIVPAPNAQGPWEETLASVLASRPTDCEVIVAHAGPYEDPYDLGGEVRFLPAPSNGGVVDCLNVGIQSARGDVVHLLSEGVVVSEGWVEPALAALAEAEAVAPLVTVSEEGEMVLAVGVRYLARGAKGVLPGRPRRPARWLNKVRPPAPVLVAGFYDRQALLELGGFDTRYGAELADAELALRMATAGYRCTIAEESRVHLAAIPAEPASFARGRAAERLFWSAAAQSGWPRSLVGHPFLVLAEWAKNIHRAGGWLQVLGRLTGALELRGNAAARARLAELGLHEEPQVHKLPQAEEVEAAPIKRAA